MSLKNNFILMAEYSQWMNGKIYSAASELSTEGLSKDCGAFFGSVLGTLNHILVADIIWLKRFADHPQNFKSLQPVRELPRLSKLDSVLFHDLGALKQQRDLVDYAVVQFADELTDSVLETDLSYQDTKGHPYTKKLGHLLQHFFNHQTHHRGQVSTLLSQFDVDVGVTDLLEKIPNS